MVTQSSSSHSSSIGILIVGFGGANGSTLACGILANRNKIQWFGPLGESQTPNYNGCITQLTPRGTAHPGVGYKSKYKEGQYLSLADVNNAAIGGWDIRPNKLGDALLDAQILDYDLVRQVRDDLNKIPIWKGYYDPRFIGSSQHNGATYTLVPNLSAADALDILRQDIRNFKQDHRVQGHTTVIWSASVEPNCPFCFEGGGLDTAAELLQSISMSEEERGGPLPPSLIYATAAILEGCSFVNGASQYIICKGLLELTHQQKQQGGGKAYCLGTDFKAGQTKFKTAAVEYLRTMGLQPKVIASSNHLGNNDMYNLATSDTARMAKLRVKNDIFSSWEEDIDHKVSVMYTPWMKDEKRDFVEYTSLAFLNQIHTMVTYTRASDSVLCVPLMIDAAVWCDYFSACEWNFENVAKATAYLFKVPEGAAKGVDPGFFRQMRELDEQFYRATCHVNTNPQIIQKRDIQQSSIAVLKQDAAMHKSKMMIPLDMSIICAGLACVDMQLLSATNGNGSESIETFDGEKTTGGGSVSMACKTISRMTYRYPIDGDQELSPVVRRVIPLCTVGADNAGDALLQFFQTSCSSHQNIDTYIIENARNVHPSTRTALAVLPIYKDGKRGCFFDAASNKTFSSSQLIGLLDEILHDQRDGLGLNIGAFIFGYPHLLPMMQGKALHDILSKARSCCSLIAVDLNGLPRSSLRSIADDHVLGAAFHLIDILHLNEDELCNLTGVSLKNESDRKDEEILDKAAQSVLDCGVAITLVTRGANGCYIRCNDQRRFDQSPKLPKSWIGSCILAKAPSIDERKAINCNGAGDAFTSGFVLAAMLRRLDSTKDDFISAETLSLKVAAQFASLVALKHICSSTRDADQLIIDDLLDLALNSE